MATVSVLLLLLLSAFSPPVHSRFTTFHVIPGNMTQSEARAACRGNYTDLVTVYSEEDNTELSNMMMEAGVSDSWIGLNSSQSSMKWSNGDPVTFINLTGTCDSSTPCAAMKADGTWESRQCTGTIYFICYEQNDSSQTPIYHPVCECKNWYEAQSYCRRNYTDLVSIMNYLQNEEVRNKWLSITNPFWIGLLCDGWHWSDGGNSAYRKWGVAEPPSPSSDLCVVLRGGNWSTEPCGEKHSALCYWNATSVNATSSSPTTHLMSHSTQKTTCVNPIPCSIQPTASANTTSSSAQTQPPGFLHVSNYTMSWEKVLDYCTRENRAGVLRISSADEQKDVKSELRRNNINNPVWVGLRKSRLLGFWFWVDGSAVYPYSNWAGGEQPDDPLTQQCGAVVPPDYTWRDMNCQARYRALCYTKCPP